MAGPGAGSARRPEPTAVQVATGSRRHGPDPASRGRCPGPREAAGVHGRPLRVVCYASFPLLRSSALRYAPFSRTVKGQEAQQREKGVADASPSGESPRCGGGSRRAPPRWTAGGPGAAPVRSEDARSAADRGRAGRRRTVRRHQKGGRRVLLTSRPAPLPSRSGAMTPFPVRAPTPTHPKGTHRPPLPRRRHAQRRPHRRSTRRARRQAPPTHPGAPDRPHPRRHRHRHTADAPGIGRRGPRARHITREHVPLADVLAG